MLYGYQTNHDNKPVTVIAAADSVDELQIWASEFSQDLKNCVSIRATGFLDHMKNPEFKGYKHPVQIVTHSSDDERDEFKKTTDIELVNQARALDLHLAMVKAKKEQIENATFGGDNDRRTIGEMHGLNSHDPWDRRSEEEKAAANKEDKLRKKLGDNVTGQSFNPDPRPVDDGIQVRDIRKQDDGTINVTGVKSAPSSGASVSSAGQVAIMETKQPSYTDVVKAMGEAVTKLEAAGFTPDEVQDIMDEVKVQRHRDNWAYVRALAKKVEEKVLEKTGSSSITVTTNVEISSNSQNATSSTNQLSPPNDDEDDEDFDDVDDEYVSQEMEQARQEEMTKRQELFDAFAKEWQTLYPKDPMPDTIKDRAHHNIFDLETPFDDIKRRVEKSLEDIRKLAAQPVAMPGDYRYAFHEDHTNNPAMGGPDTPVFTVAINPNGPSGGKFGFKYLSGVLAKIDKRFESISHGMTVGTICFNGDAIEAHNLLQAAGMVEDVSIAGIKGKPMANMMPNGGTNLAAPKKKITAEQVARALAGDGTSTMSGTGSWGKNKVGLTEEDFVEKIQSKLGPRGVPLNIVDALTPVDYDNLPYDIQMKYGDDIKESTILIGKYNGHVIPGERYIVPIDTNLDEVIGEVNVKHLGATVFGPLRMEIYVRETLKNDSYVILRAQSLHNAVVIIKL